MARTRICKTRIDCWISPTEYVKLLTYTGKNGFVNLSQAINHILNEFFAGVTELETTVNNLNKALGVKDEKIRQLEFEIRTKHATVVKK